MQKLARWPAQLFKRLIPHLNVETIYNIDVRELWRSGVRGIITDLDNTLVGAKDPHATPELMGWLKQVREQGFKIVIVSNNQYTRVAQFAEPLQIPYIHRAKKPTNFAFKKAIEIMGIEPRQTVVIGDQMLTDVLGGNRMGLYTVLVTPISLGDEGFFTKINRRIERFALKIMKKQGLMPWED
jgi:HAD superfamily phosphatase (TIGR01668 family)